MAALNSAYRGLVLRRILQGLVVILLAYVLSFIVISVLPGDAITNALRDPQAGLSEEEIGAIVAFYGLDKPVHVQLLLSLGRFATGDLGISLQSSLPVADLILEALPSTILLAVLALIIALVLAFGIAIGAYHLPPRIAGVVRSIPSLFLSVPNFVIGLVLISVFGFTLHLFTIAQPDSLTATFFAAVTLAIPVSAPLAEVLISSLDNESGQDYVLVARSRGLSRLQLFFRHLLKPSALPSVTMIALLIGELLGGAVITETIFGRNGIGTLVQRSVAAGDQPVLQAVVVLSATIFVIVNAIADLTVPFLDPRTGIEQKKLVTA